MPSLCLNHKNRIRAGWVSRAGSSMRDLFVGGSSSTTGTSGNAAPTTHPTTSSPLPSANRGGADSATAAGSGAAGRLDQSEDGSGMLSGASRDMMQFVERQRQEQQQQAQGTKRTGWGCCGVVQVRVYVYIECFMPSVWNSPCLGELWKR